MNDGNRPVDVFVRIAAKTDASGGPDACWLWTGAKWQKGTPVTTIQGKAHPVRRLLWERDRGPLPTGRAVVPGCENARCVNPAHLELAMFRSDPVERFWSHVDKRGPDECWPWKEGHAAFKKGYGMFIIGWKKPVVQASRHAYEITHGVTLETEDFVMHSCDNPPCCNPAHLSKGNALLNHRDMVAKGRAAWQRPKTGTDHE